MATAGIILIGDELLSGQVTDANLPYIAPRLFSNGIDLKEVVIVGDVESQIIDVVQRFSKAYTFVFTTGGIGPTHDDITAPTIAKAFDLKTIVNQEALSWMDGHYGEVVNEAALRGRKQMATMPEDSILIPNPLTGAAGFQIKNVYVMAGIPMVMQAMFDGLLPGLTGKTPKGINHIYCSVAESQIAKGLHDIQHANSAVEIGSYPQWQGHVSKDLCITLKSVDMEILEIATQEVFKLCEQLEGSPRRG